MVPHQAPLSPHDEVSEAAGAARAQREGAMPISCCPSNVILDHVAVETQWTQDESIEFSSDVTIILGLVYKHTFQMLSGVSFVGETHFCGALVTGNNTTVK